MNETKNLKAVTNAWLIAWAFTYLATAIFAPGIAGDILTGQILYGAMGIAIIVALGLLHAKTSVSLGKTVRYFLGAGILFMLSAFSVYGAVASWAGLFVWNVPFQAKEIFQVTMGLMDFLSAVFMLIRVTLET